MKDQELFLNNKFGLIDLIEFKHTMEQNGWIIVTNSVNSVTEVTIYENEDDRKWEEAMIMSTADTFEKAFLICLIEIKNYYKYKS